MVNYMEELSVTEADNLKTKYPEAQISKKYISTILRAFAKKLREDLPS